MRVYGVFIRSGSEAAHPSSEMDSLHTTREGAIARAVELVRPAEDRWGEPEESPTSSVFWSRLWAPLYGNPRLWEWAHYAVAVDSLYVEENNQPQEKA